MAIKLPYKSYGETNAGSLVLYEPYPFATLPSQNLQGVTNLNWNAFAPSGSVPPLYTFVGLEFYPNGTWNAINAVSGVNLTGVWRNSNYPEPSPGALYEIQFIQVPFFGAMLYYGSPPNVYLPLTSMQFGAFVKGAAGLGLAYLFVSIRPIIYPNAAVNSNCTMVILP